MQRAADTSTRQRRSIRSGAVLAVVAATIAWATWQQTNDAAASASDEAAFVAAINQVRANNGLGPLTPNAELADLSRGHAQVMADAGDIFHASPISEGYTGPWSKIGENVGVGASVPVLVDAFVASPGHFANIIDPAFTEIGVGVVWDGSALYTTHRFLQVIDAPPTTTSPPTTVPPTTTAPPVPPPTTSTPPATTTADPSEPPAGPVVEALPPPPISAERITALLDMLDQVGT